MRGAGRENVEGDVQEALEEVREDDGEAEKERERRLLDA